VTRFRVIPEQSQVWIEARSSLHPIHGQGTGIQGEAELEVTDGQIDLSVPPRGRIEFPVERLTPGMLSRTWRCAAGLRPESIR
jgi:hypothetical protein